MYPESRHLTEEQKDEMYGFFALNVPAARIVQHFEVKHNVHLQSQDVHNHRVSYRKELTGGLSEEDATYRLFQDILKKDPGAVIEVVCDSRNIASIIFVQTSQMKEILCRYPSVLFLDTTYKVNTRSMPLFSVMVVDGNNSGQVVAYGLVINECAETVTKLMEVFVKYNQSQASHVESVIIDKDFSEIKAVKSVLPEAKIIICKFHVIQAIQRALKGYTSADKESVMEIIHKLLRCSPVEEYDKLVDQLKARVPAFFHYFNAHWHSIRESWAGCFVRDHTTYGNLTNNFVESHHQKIKAFVGRNTTIPQLIQDLIALNVRRQGKSDITRSKLSLKKKACDCFRGGCVGSHQTDLQHCSPLSIKNYENGTVEIKWTGIFD